MIKDNFYVLELVVHVFFVFRKYSFMKNIRLCANILVKNCFTSDICYDPRLSVRQARSVGIKAVDENFAPMPREMNFFLPKDKVKIKLLFANIFAFEYFFDPLQSSIYP